LSCGLMLRSRVDNEVSPAMGRVLDKECLLAILRADAV